MSDVTESITETSVKRPDLVDLVRTAFLSAKAGNSALDPEVFNIDGMSGRKYRRFINNLVRSLGDTSYLEVGSFSGSTLCSAINGNNVRATAVDNWSEFGGPKAKFLENLARFKTSQARVTFIEADFRSVDYSAIGPFEIYLFDGPHGHQDQYDGLKLALPALKHRFVFIVDDWNMGFVRSGTINAIADLGIGIAYSIEVRTTLDDTHPDHYGSASDWHNGYFIGVLSKSD